MSEKDIWSSILDGHPIFSIPRNVAREEDLELSFDTLPTFSFNTSEDASSGPNPMAGRKQIMCMKDSDLIVACGSEIRMTSLGDAKVSGGSKRNYKVCSVSVGVAVDLVKLMKPYYHRSYILRTSLLTSNKYAYVRIESCWR